MAERNNDKGFITWIMTIINLVLGAVFAGGLLIGSIVEIVDVIGNGGDILGMIMTIIMLIVWACFAWYWIKRSIMIILGKEANTWVYVAVSFFMSAIIGGVLMLIAKILN